MKLPVFLAVLLCCSVCASAKHVWLNDWFRQISAFTCRDGWSFGSIATKNSNEYDDRKWAFTCVKITEKSNTCTWTGYLNKAESLLKYQCESNGFINGILSYFDYGLKDRIFKIRCCSNPGAVLKNCKFTEYQTDYRASFDYKVPSNKILNGVLSSFNKTYADRLWKFRLCDKP